ncbi:carbohydrate kinase family protein [Marinobacter sp. JSM 1782161]|uniref:carbohydrate kinase family protein n=1 Tax=Marinobacter sp. JSM 1782161 TaxID=2685906 RepID=UPI0014021A92|nr:carbohydrate kinase [Marinobacter sp. JSM 1782161]
MTRVIAFGEALIDMLARPGDDGQRTFLEQAGGAPANVAVGVAKLGGQACFMGQVGKDMFGDMLVRTMADYGVDTHALHQTAAGMTALAFVSLDADGERSFAFYRDGSADLLYRIEHVPDGLFDTPAIFHCCSNTLTDPEIADTTLALMQQARDAGCLVSFDVNYRHNLWPKTATPADTIADAMALAHVVKLSREELEALYGDEQTTVTRLLDDGAQLVLVTDGGNPLNVYWPGGATDIAPVPADMTDSTAAGDAFVAGLLHRLAEQGITRETLTGWIANKAQLEKDLQFACRCGAVAVSRYGAFDALPTAGDL